MNKIPEYEEFIRNIGYMGLLEWVARLKGIILMPLLVGFLGVSAYGEYMLAIVLVNFGSQVCKMGQGEAIVRFLTGKPKREASYIFYTSIYLTIVVSLVFSFIIYIFSDSLSSIFDLKNELFKVVSFLVLVWSLGTLIVEYFRAYKNIIKYGLFKNILPIIEIIVSIYVIFSGYGVIEILLASFAVRSIFLIGMFVYIAKEIGVSFPQKVYAKELIKYGIPLAPLPALMWVIEASDKYIIGFFLNTAAVGLYSIGYTLAKVVILALSPLRIVLFPYIVEHYSNDRLSEIETYLAYSFKWCLLVGLPLIFILTGLATPLIELFGESSINTELVTRIVFIVSIASLMHILYNLNSQIISLLKKTNIIFFVLTLVATINFLVNIFSIPKIGVLGAAISTLISYITAYIITEKYSGRYIKVRKKLTVVAKSLFASVVVFMFIVIANPKGLFSIMLTGIIVIVMYFLILLLSKTFDAREIKILKKLIKIF